MKIQFCGAAKSVTGSCHMLHTTGGNILIDCGMRQGEDQKTGYGEGNFPFEPASISAVLLTHAHIDHSGLIPLLAKRGFKGSIVTTQATAMLSTIMLPDSGHIQEQEAEYTNRKRMRAGQPPVEPLYTVKDANASLQLFRPAQYGDVVQVLPGVRVRFNDIGHLLGSAAIEIWVEEGGNTTNIVFSGDIGRDDRPIIRDPQDIQAADYLVIEGTYGNRNHEVSTDSAKEAQFANVLRAAIARGGNIVIPSFAVGRTQELLYYIKRLLSTNAIPELQRIPVYIDSPLGIEATKIYERCAAGYYDEEALKLSQSGSPFDFPTLRVARSAEESKQINFEPGTSIIISASGMCEAGRIRHHLKHNLYRADSTVIFAGYQAVGTLGRMLLDGAKKVKLFGEEVRVNATIEQIEGFSGHAGRDELIEWIRNIPEKPRRIFMVHGEEDALASLSEAVESLGYSVEVPSLGDVFDLKTSVRHRVNAPEASVSELDALRREAGVAEQANRILALLDSIKERRSPDTELKVEIMEADLQAVADKWERLFRVLK